MSRQVEKETSDWNVRRQAFQAALTAALPLGDFKSVATRPYDDADQGDFGFPKSNELEQKLLTGYADQRSTQLNGSDQVGILLQLNTLESFRRANLSQKQSRREMLAHLVVTGANRPKFDDLMLQVMAGTAKVVSSDR